MSNQQKSSAYKNSAQVRRSERFWSDAVSPLIVCTLEAVMLIGICAILNLFAKSEETRHVVSIISTLSLPFYLFSAGTLCLLYSLKSRRTKRARLEAEQMETEIYDMFRYMIDLPYAIVDPQGKVKIINGALQDVLGFKSAVSGIDISEFCSVPIKYMTNSARNRDVYVSDTMYDMPQNARTSDVHISRLPNGRRYEVISYIFKTQGENYFFVVFEDTENYLALAEKFESENAVVAYIVLDNLQELTEYVRADYRSASTEAENIIREWIALMNGFVREYANDKYIAVFSKENLDEQMRNDFDIQKRIMDLKVGDNSFPITLSMGIAATDGSFQEKEKAASRALSIAISRGGGQIAVKKGESSDYIFFGGTHKTIENNTSIVSRVSGQILEDKIRKCSNVLIMGHANPDFDSVGACVGAARFAVSVIEEAHSNVAPGSRPQVNIVIDKSSDSFKTCMSQLRPLGIYENIFIERAIAKDLVSSDTVLIICDVNNPLIYQAPELMETVNNIALLDHHRLAAALTYEPFLQYVQTTKSSASEIVAEILMQSRFSDSLHKEEAEVLLSGIMLDTHNFTRNAGAQTFETAHYLYSRGAHTGVVREFFNESLEELLLTGEFESKARIYRDSIAITWMTIDRPGTSEDRVVASKVADNLLNIKGVKASFALIKIDENVSISGRSKGEINVQLILERLKGGGHFDIAGAQIRNESLTKACEMLKDAIDDYFEYDYNNSNDR